MNADANYLLKTNAKPTRAPCARAAGLAGALKRIEPGTGDEVRVVFEKASFPDLMRWLTATVADRPLAVTRLTADRAGPGRVDCVVVLRRTDLGRE